MDIKIRGKYKLGKKIGGGSYGEIYEGIDISNNIKYAIKLESRKVKTPRLEFEFRVCRCLHGVPGTPEAFWYGKEGDFNVMVMELLGPNFETLSKRSPRILSEKTCFLAMDRVLARLEALHGRGLVHRDVKPANVTLGVGAKADVVYLIDFGLAKFYVDKKTRAHVPYAEGKSLCGTALFASLNAHLGVTLSRRDDVESLGYVCVYLINGTLPWSKYGITKGDAKMTREDYTRLVELKISTPLSTYCKQAELVEYLEYCRSLHYEDKPDYDKLHRLLKQAAAKCEEVKND